MADGNLTLEEFWKLPPKERCKRYSELSNHEQFGVRQADGGAVSVPCNDCAHYFGYAKCAAYPDGIPSAHMDDVQKNRAAGCGNGYRFQEK